MKELEQFLENELNGLALKKADWGHLTIEDDSRERTLLEVQELVKKLPIHNVVGSYSQEEIEAAYDKGLEDGYACMPSNI
ncbi:MAG: hypothetical protein RBT65_17465 [Methanolobus sp.]|jgi:hypothetical protein|nr:hypothetical protein [Methanolobus sp.]